MWLQSQLCWISYVLSLSPPGVIMLSHTQMSYDLSHPDVDNYGRCHMPSHPHTHTAYAFSHPHVIRPLTPTCHMSSHTQMLLIMSDVICCLTLTPTCHMSSHTQVLYALLLKLFSLQLWYALSLSCKDFMCPLILTPDVI